MLRYNIIKNAYCQQIEQYFFQKNCGFLFGEKQKRTDASKMVDVSLQKARKKGFSPLFLIIYRSENKSGDGSILISVAFSFVRFLLGVNRLGLLVSPLS